MKRFGIFGTNRNDMILPQLRHALLARHRKGHGIHSPYLYHLVNQVLFNKYRYYSFETIESLFPATQREHIQGQTLFRLADDINATTIVVCCESDTIDMVYLKSVKADARIIRLTNPEELNKVGTIDLAVLDLPHDKTKLSDLFDVMLSHASLTSVFVVKDIYRKGMEDCWDTLIKNPQVKASLNVYHYGMVLFRPDLEKRTYRIRQ